MKFHKKKETIQNIDISPLIDMVFILLIFFMVSTTFNKDMKLDLTRPGASSASMASDESIRVFIDSSSEIYIDEQPTQLWMVQSRVRDALDGQNDKPILVITDKGVSSELLIDVVDQCRLAGASDVGVATEKESRAS